MPLINTRGAASIKGFGFAGFSPTVPGKPTSVSASATSCSAISVSFTAPACNGGLSIDYYQAVCTASGTHSATGTSPISITGLSAATSYTFKVRAHNSLGYGCYSSSTGTATTQVAPGSQSYTTPATSYTWVAPAGVTSVSAVAVGGGGGGNFSGTGGGGLGYKNNISVNPGCSYTVKVSCGGCVFFGSYMAGAGGDSWFISSSTVKGSGSNSASGGGYVGDGGGNGGCGNSSSQGGGGGAGGYSGKGGNGGHNSGATAGLGGGGGGGCTVAGAGAYCTPLGGAGGGVGIYGQGCSGSGSCNGGGGSGGSGGFICFHRSYGGTYGGGAGGAGCGCARSGPLYGYGRTGAVRIVWPGNNRRFPSTCVGSP